MLSLRAKIAASGLLAAAAAVASGVGATPASAATETVTVTIQVTRNTAPAGPSVLYIVGDVTRPQDVRCAGIGVPTPTIEVVAPKGKTIRLYSVSRCYSGLGGKASVVADATKTVQVSL